MFKKICFFVMAAVASGGMIAAPRVEIVKAGAVKYSVSINIAAADANAKAYVTTLRRNLEISSFFEIASKDGSIEISGTVGNQIAVKAAGRGKTVSGGGVVTDAKSARMAARKFADEMVKAYCDAQGMASSRIVFVDRKGSDNAELYTCYPDGQDMRQITADKSAAAAPRWAPDAKTVYYISWKSKKPLVYRIDVDTGARNLLAPFKGSVTGFALSPDGSQAAIVLSHEGNPELYVLDLKTSRLRRLTNTKNATEASPCWSPDGKSIAYVSDVTRHPQIYIVDVTTKNSRRVTRTGVENVNPDWSSDGKLVWCSKRSGSCIVVMDPEKGESSERVIGTPARWEHPSWARDCRHVVANDGKDLYLIDTEENGDKPRRLFGNAGNWMNADWSK